MLTFTAAQQAELSEAMRAFNGAATLVNAYTMERQQMPEGCGERLIVAFKRKSDGKSHHFTAQLMGRSLVDVIAGLAQQADEWAKATP